jgi:class 3 adenylate cyclase
MTVCPACAAPASADARFCSACGAALGAGSRRRPEERRRGEERRVVSVLFVDVVGWTSAAEQLDPEDLRIAQSDYFAAVRTVIDQSGGTLEKYIGDAVLACFGAPRATEDDALRAVRAALLIQDALGDLTVGDSPLEARIGVATAVALVDLDADPARGQAFVTGDVVNLAARLQAAAPANGVLVGRSTYEATAGSVEYEQVGPLTLKGKAAPVEAFLARALAVQAPRRPQHELPFVGRTPQLRLLESCLDRVIGDGAGALVSITGEPGIGKSRLVHELRQARAEQSAGHAAHAFRTPPLRWLSASCISFDSKGGHAPLLALIEQAGRGADLEEAPRSGEGVAETWRRAMIALAEEAPTVIVLEDLHRAEDALLDAVDELLALAAEVPLLLFVTAWPELLERRPGWGAAGSDTVTLSLPPLDEAATVQLLTALLGDDLPPAALARLVALAGGNPLYAEECAGMLRDREAAQLVRGLPELPLPRSVKGLVASRLDLISDDERGVLHAAAVLGESCWPGPVALLADLPSSEAEVGLAQLARRGMLRRVRPSTVPGEPEYAFRSALVRELVYSRLPRSRRLHQHARAGDWWASRPAGRDAECAELVAHHRVLAAELAAALRSPDAQLHAEQARDALREAAERSYGLRALLPTRSHLERALALWPEDVDPVGRHSCLRLVEEVSFLAGRDEFVREGGPGRVAAIARTLRELGAGAEAARAHTLLGQVAWWVADRAEALEQHRQAVALLAGLPPGEQQALALAELARLQMLCQQASEAIDTGRAAVALAERLGLPEAVANALCTVGVARYLAGDADGVADQELALELARREQLAALPRVANNLANTLQEEGELRRSYALMDEAVIAAQPGGGAGLHSLQAEPEAALRACNQGDWELALSLADGFLDQTPGRSGPWEAQLRGLRAWLRLLQGHPPGPLLTSLDAAIDQARSSGFPQIVRPVLAFAARCAALEHDTARAAACYDELWAGWHGDGDDPGGTRETPSREWLPAAVTVACYLDEQAEQATGPERHARADRLVAVLQAAPHQTRWVKAALASLASARARAAGDAPEALAAAEQAVALYGDIGDETERGLAVAVAAARERELRGPGRWEWELAAFAARTGAVRLLPAPSAAADLLGLIPDHRSAAAERQRD